MEEVRAEALTLCGFFFLLLFATVASGISSKFYNPRKHLFQFVLCLFLVLQSSLRCSLLILAVVFDVRRAGDFWNNFPASIFTTCCSIVLLHWVKVAGPGIVSAVYLALAVVVNSLMYLSLFVAFGLEVYWESRIATVLFSAIYSAVWVLFVIAVVSFYLKVAPFEQHTLKQQWLEKKRPVLTGFTLLCGCLMIRSGMLIYSTVEYNNTCNLVFSQPPSQSSANPGGTPIESLPMMFLIMYYVIGEFFGGIGMLVITHNLRGIGDSDETPKHNSFGELERLIKEMNKETATKEDLEEKLICKVCLEREIATLFQPCRHSCLCEHCASIVSECPVCRRPIGQVISIFRS